MRQAKNAKRTSGSENPFEESDFGKAFGVAFAAAVRQRDSRKTLEHPEIARAFGRGFASAYNTLLRLRQDAE